MAEFSGEMLRVVLTAADTRRAVLSEPFKGHGVIALKRWLPCRAIKPWRNSIRLMVGFLTN